MMRRSILGLAAALLLCGPAMADDQQPPPQPVDSHLASALDLLEAMNAKSNLEAFVDTMLPIADDAIRKDHPDISEDTIKQFEAAFRDEMDHSLDDLMRLQAQVYAEHFTEEELRGLSAFYRSDTGKKYIAEVPLIMKEVAPLGQAWGRSIGERAMKRAVERIEKKGVQL